jgi:hypothetical protein
MEYSDYHIDEFVQEIVEELISPLFGSSADVLFDDNNVQRFLAAACEVDKHNRYDLAKCDIHSMSHICEHTLFYLQKLVDIPNYSIFPEIAENKYLNLERALRKTWAFITVHDRTIPVCSDLLPEDVAALTGLKESTLRNAIPQVFSKTFDERLNGLENSSRVPDITIFDSESETDELAFPTDLKDTNEWQIRVFRRAEAREVSQNNLNELISDLEISARGLLVGCQRSPEMIIKLADLISFERNTFIQGTLAAISNELQSEQEVVADLLYYTESRQPRALARGDEALISANELKDLIITEFEGDLHTLYRGNKKLIGMQLNSSKTLAIETSKKPQIWINAEHFSEPLSKWLVKRYETTTPEESLYQRHSGLRLYDELGTAEVVKLRIRTYGDARAVLNLLA